MHPRNPYKVSPDFFALAESFPPLKPFVSTSDSGNPFIDFKDPDAQRALTQSLLKRDFNLTLSLPENRLCPVIPNRLNYILWLQDILFSLEPAALDQRVRGLDIGTGSSAIYPLLACSLPSTRAWEFIGTEIDPLSCTFASQNVKANNLCNRITIWPIRAQSPPAQNEIFESSIPPIFAPLIENKEASFDFTMCNPPFYGSASEIENSAEGKDLPPNAVCTGAETEMITPGGETAFVLQMVRESAQEDVRGRCRWFTSMLGKLSSVGTVVEELRKREILNYAITQFIQGTTRRWGVGWSFGEERLPDAVSRPTSASLAPYIPVPTTLRQSFSISQQVTTRKVPLIPHEFLSSALTQVLASVEGLIVHEYNDPAPMSSTEETPERAWKVDVQAQENTWSRAARRRRKRPASPSEGRAGKAQRLDTTSVPARQERTARGDESARAALRCRICVLPVLDSEVADPRHVTLEAQWVRGQDRALFEGFWSHICRKIKDQVDASPRDG